MGGRQAVGRWGCALVVVATVSSCGQPSSEPPDGGERRPSLIAQCLDARVSPMPPPLVCTLDEDGAIVDITDVALDSGETFVLDRSSGRVAARLSDGTLAAVTGGVSGAIAASDATVAYAFSRSGELVTLDAAGTLRDSNGETLVDFDPGFPIEVHAGLDLHDGKALMTVDRSPDGFGVVIGDVETGAITEIARTTGAEARGTPSFVGWARWSPSGERIVFLGQDYESIVVTTASGEPLSVIQPRDRRFSRTYLTPAWIDDDTVVFLDAVPAVVVADVSTGEVLRVTVYDSTEEIYPAIPAPLLGQLVEPPD